MDDKLSSMAAFIKEPTIEELKERGQAWYNDYGPYHFHKWYAEFSDVTPHSAMFTFPWELIEAWLKYDHPDSKKAEECFFDRASELLRDDSTLCVYKLSTRSPKDCCGGLIAPIFHILAHAFDGMASSLRCYEDLAMHINAQVDPVIVMRHFHPEILADQEYRLYIHDGTLKGVSANQHGVARKIEDHEKDCIIAWWHALEGRFKKLGITEAAIDIGFRHTELHCAPEKEYWLIEINPFYGADPINFVTHKNILDSYVPCMPLFLHEKIKDKKDES